MKGIKMLLGAFAAASLLFSFNANAQENANRDENGKVVRGAYETNKAFDNIFIGIAAGVNSTKTFGQNAAFGGFGLAADINVGKWFTPAVGLRAGWHGFWDNAKNGFTVNNIDKNDKFGFNYIHGDVLWNISNSIGGYKETRVWNIIPYMSMGVLDVTKTLNPFDKSRNLEFAAGPGILNNFRLSNRVNLTLDIMALFGKAAAYTKSSSIVIMFPSVTAGLSFNLGKTNFDRHTSITPVVIPVPFTTEQYNALADKVAALEKENAQLKDKIAALEKELAPYKNLVNGQTYLFENGKFTAVEITNATPLSVYFDLGSSKLSAREKAHLEYFCENAVDADTKISINGYADKQTGSARTNQKLSESRVKTVVDLLLKAGAQEGNIETAAHGDTINLFNTAAKNRVVTIEIK